VPEEVERHPWDRLPSETPRAYEGFRQFREAGPRRRLADVSTTTTKQARHWSRIHHWAARATAWDDEVHRLEDVDRLDQLRTMHGNHARAARALQQFALRALQALDTDTTSAADVARLFELGAKLERLTLSQSIDELQGRVPTPDLEDPWQRIAHELANPSIDQSA
jgi:hypothetical protein